MSRGIDMCRGVLEDFAKRLKLEFEADEYGERTFYGYEVQEIIDRIIRGGRDGL